MRPCGLLTAGAWQIAENGSDLRRLFRRLTGPVAHPGDALHVPDRTNQVNSSGAAPMAGDRHDARRHDARRRNARRHDARRHDARRHAHLESVRVERKLPAIISLTTSPRIRSWACRGRRARPPGSRFRPCGRLNPARGRRACGTAAILTMSLYAAVPGQPRRHWSSHLSRCDSLAITPLPPKSQTQQRTLVSRALIQYIVRSRDVHLRIYGTALPDIQADHGMLTGMAKTGRPKAELTFSDNERATLGRWARRAKSSQAMALRANIIVACAEGYNNKETAARLRCNHTTVGKWRKRFIDKRLDGLHDETPVTGQVRLLLLGAPAAACSCWARLLSCWSPELQGTPYHRPAPDRRHPAGRGVVRMP